MLKWLKNFIPKPYSSLPCVCKIYTDCYLVYFCEEHKKMEGRIMGIEIPKNGYIAAGKTYLSGKGIEEEFKVDKLGWYGSNLNNKYKLLQTLKRDTPMHICCDETESNIIWFTYKGINESNDGENLIKYLGPELPTKPREFEFEAIVSSYETFHRFPSEEGIKPFTFRVELKCIGEPIKFPPGMFKVTLKELIDE